LNRHPIIKIIEIIKIITYADNPRYSISCSIRMEKPSMRWILENEFIRTVSKYVP
jgi:hypothetical protein